MLKILRLVFLCGPHLFGSYFSWIRKYAKNPQKYPFDERYYKIRELISSVFTKMKIDVNIDNYKELTNLKQKTLIVGNHQSMVDILLLITLSPQPLTFIAKAEVKRMPFVGKILKILEGGFLQRDDPRQSIEVFRNSSKMISNNVCHVCIYPEGHRTKNPYGELLDFHAGSFKIAYWNKAPILKFAEFGTFKPISLKENAKTASIFISFLNVSTFEDYSNYSTTEYAPIVKNEVFDRVQKLIKLDAQYKKQGLNNKQPSYNWVKQLNLK